MADLVVGFYKKTPRPVNVALHIFLSFTVQSMSADPEVQDLLREFRERVMQNLMRNPPASPPHEETFQDERLCTTVSNLDREDERET